MPIHYRETSIFEPAVGVNALVNPVNCMGVMGAGLALEFKKRNIGMHETYRRLCAQGAMKLGEIAIYNTWSDGKIVLFPTKRHWQNNSTLGDIEAGLIDFVAKYEAAGITSVAFPMLGCGLGGLDWSEVKPKMYHYLAHLPIPVYIHIYNPRGAK